MKLILIRHGEPDYSGVTERGYIGQGRALAPLTAEGRRQAEEASCDPRLTGAELCLSSPYTRALQTAAVLSRKTGLELRVELCLHEWIADTSFRFDSGEYEEAASRECTAHRGVRSPDCEYLWEPLSDLADRVYRALYPYLDYEKIIVVTHGVVMRQFFPREKIPYCGIRELDFSREFAWPGFITGE